MPLIAPLLRTPPPCCHWPCIVVQRRCCRQSVQNGSGTPRPCPSYLLATPPLLPSSTNLTPFTPLHTPLTLRCCAVPLLPQASSEKGPGAPCPSYPPSPLLPPLHPYQQPRPLTLGPPAGRLLGRGLGGQGGQGQRRRRGLGAPRLLLLLLLPPLPALIEGMRGSETCIGLFK